MVTVIDKRPPADTPTLLADHAGHDVTLTALVLALAKHHAETATEEQTNEFLSYFASQSEEMAKQLGVPAIEKAAEQKTSRLAAMLLEKHRTIPK